MVKKREIQIIAALQQGDRLRGTTTYEICKAIGAKFGTLYPALRRLESEGYIESRWEGEGWPSGGPYIDDAPEEGRPRRRYYRATEDGTQERVRQTATEIPTRKRRLGLRSREV